MTMRKDGILPPSSGRRCPEGAEVGSQRNEKKWEEVFPRFVIPSAAEGSFSLAVRRRVFDSRERETPYLERAEAVLSLKGLAKGSWEKGTKKISRFCTCQQKLDTKLKKLGIKIEYLYKIQ